MRPIRLAQTLAGTQVHKQLLILPISWIEEQLHYDDFGTTQIAAWLRRPFFLDLAIVRPPQLTSQKVRIAPNLSNKFI
jgi:hypothetical protein